MKVQTLLHGCCLGKSSQTEFEHGVRKPVSHLPSKIYHTCMLWARTTITMEHMNDSHIWMILPGYK